MLFSKSLLACATTDDSLLLSLNFDYASLGKLRAVLYNHRRLVDCRVLLAHRVTKCSSILSDTIN